ncbi:MAG: Uma2 family endonuclease [Acidobacteria bacterium]|nr:Uma2 family endonuclease [Acidobacteriota bacterium]
MSTKTEATIDGLYKVKTKAEIVNGEIVHMSPTGNLPNYAAGEVFVSLRAYVKERKGGRAISDNAAFVVNLPHRKSFSPDAAFYVGPDPGMKFFEVDLLGEDVVRSYSADAPDRPRVFRRGETADAEPAVPGWSMPVNDLFLD